MVIGAFAPRMECAQQTFSCFASSFTFHFSKRSVWQTLTVTMTPVTRVAAEWLHKWLRHNNSQNKHFVYCGRRTGALNLVDFCIARLRVRRHTRWVHTRRRIIRCEVHVGFNLYSPRHSQFQHWHGIEATQKHVILSVALARILSKLSSVCQNVAIHTLSIGKYDHKPHGNFGLNTRNLYFPYAK